MPNKNLIRASVMSATSTSYGIKPFNEELAYQRLIDKENGLIQASLSCRGHPRSVRVTGKLIFLDQTWN